MASCRGKLAVCAGRLVPWFVEPVVLPHNTARGARELKRIAKQMNQIRRDASARESRRPAGGARPGPRALAPAPGMHAAPQRSPRDPRRGRPPPPPPPSLQLEGVDAPVVLRGQLLAGGQAGGAHDLTGACSGWWRTEKDESAAAARRGQATARAGAEEGAERRPGRRSSAWSAAKVSVLGSTDRPGGCPRTSLLPPQAWPAGGSTPPRPHTERAARSPPPPPCRPHQHTRRRAFRPPARCRCSRRRPGSQCPRSTCSAAWPAPEGAADGGGGLSDQHACADGRDGLLSPGHPRPSAAAGRLAASPQCCAAPQHRAHGRGRGRRKPHGHAPGA